jgi:hypothetical protein
VRDEEKVNRGDRLTAITILGRWQLDLKMVNSKSKPIEERIFAERLKDENYDAYAGFEGSIGRAESMVDNLLAAASGIAMVINHYKKEELRKRIAEIEESDLSESGVRKKVLADIVRLKTMMDLLQDKMVRVSLYQWKIKGE